MHASALRRAIALPVIAALALAACTSAGSVTVKGAWVRVTDPTKTSAGYMVIENTTSKADALTAVSTPAYAKVELHETVAVTPPSGMPASGMPMGSMAPASMAPGSAAPMTSMAPGAASTGPMMKMQPVSEIVVPANGSVELKAGSYHLMLMEPTGTIKIGDTIELTLTFKNGGTIKVTAEIKGV